MGSLQVKSGVAGCATAASAGATCNTTVTWLTTFGDTSYTVYCSGIGVTSGTPVQSGIAKNATNAVVTTAAVTASAAQFTNIECVGIHN